jgi:hypothetical protein
MITCQRIIYLRNRRNARFQQGDPRGAMLLGQVYRFGSFAKTERDAAFTSMFPANRDKGTARAAVILAEIRKQPTPAKTP